MRCMTIIIAALLFVGCGHSQLLTSAGNANETASDASTSTNRSFSFGSDFPADMVIPAIDGMRSTAFVVSVANPAGVMAIDLDADQLKLSDRFAGMISPAGSGIPNSLVIVSVDEAFLLTSNSIITFDPTSGTIVNVTSALEPITIGPGHLNSRGVPIPATITPLFPGGIAVQGRTLYVASANYTQTVVPAIASPGTIQIFSVAADHSLQRTGFLTTTCFNPTAITVRDDDEMVVTDSGVIDIVAGQAIAKSKSCIDIIDTATHAITASIDLGFSAASFHQIALTHDGSRGFLGSAASGKVYEIDLLNRRAIHGADNPIIIGQSADYITDVDLSVDDATLFVASFEQSAVIPIDLSTTPYTVGDPIVVGFPAGVTNENPSGANTGAGPIAIRPGSRGEDYRDEDLFILTGYPGQLIAHDSGRPATLPAPIAEPAAVAPPPPPPPTGDPNTACQGFAQAVVSFLPGTGAGFGQGNMPNVVLGPPHGGGALTGSLDVVSLGRNGTIVLDLGNCHAIDRAGPDLIIFENPFFIGGDPNAPYRELGVVGVSMDGVHFTEFACTATAYPYDGCAGWHPVFSNPDNGISPFDVTAAGGDAFDLATINVPEARYVRIRDKNNTSLGGKSAGFDLDAIAVINGIIH